MIAEAPMLPIFLTILLAQQPATVETPVFPEPSIPEADAREPDGRPIGVAACDEPRLAVARELRRLFLDPTDANRVEVASRIRQGPLEQVRNGPDNHGWKRICLEGIEGQVSGIEGTARSSKEYPGLWYSYGSAYPTKFPKAEAQRLLQKARESCSKPPADDAMETDCLPLLQLHLAYANDPLARRYVERWPDELKLWFQMATDLPDRRKRLLQALDLPVESTDKARRYVFNVALDELIGAMDPRTWDPGDLALVIAEAREEDRLVAPVPPPWDPRDGIGRGGDPHSFYLRKLLDRLTTRIGLRRAIDLVQPATYEFPGINAPPLLPEMADQRFFFGPEHFEDELFLYYAEWAEAHPELPPFFTLRREEAKKPRIERNLYARKRWFETDDLAPHPDMEKVRAAVKVLEAEKAGEKP